MSELPPHIQNARVLIVDDDLTNVMLLQRLLKAEGYVHVEGVTDPREVRPLYEANPFDLVLLDISMPHLDGYEVMGQLREISSGDYLPIMVLTAQADQETKLKALESGAMDFLHKPFDRIETLTRIRNMIEARLLHKQVLNQNVELEKRVRERTRELEATRSIIDQMRNFICLCDSNGNVQHLNAAAKLLLRSSNIDNFYGRPITDFVMPDFVEIFQEGLEVFTDEVEGVPLKIRTVTNIPIDVFFYVNKLNFTGDGSDFLIECHDVSNFIMASEAARSRENRLNAILKTVDQAVITIDEFGAITGFNDAGVSTFGYKKSDAIGQNVKMLMPEPHRSQHDEYITRYLCGAPAKILNKPWETEAVRADGTTFPVEMAVTEHVERGGRRSFIGMIRDISQKKAQDERIRFLAMHDSLTGLPNRNKFKERLSESIARSKRSKKLMALMFVDLDKFKPINDTFGHDAGDHVLKVTANRLAESIRETDMAARIGGDEFVLILEDLSGRAAVEKVAVQILNSVRNQIMFDSNDCSVGASIGISLYPDHATDEEGLIKKADEAMYAVKKAGRNDFRIVD